MGIGSGLGSFAAALEAGRREYVKQSPKGAYTNLTPIEVASSEMIAEKPYSGEKMDSKGLLDAIAKSEGTYKTGYDTEYLYGKYGENRKKFDEMTIGEVLDYQDKMVAKQSSQKLKSSAVGRYQMLRQTIRDEMKHSGYTTTDLFTPEVQDKLMLSRLKRLRGYDDWKSGKIKDDDFVYNLSKEFASIANPKTGKSYYPGQKAKILNLGGIDNENN